MKDIYLFPVPANDSIPYFLEALPQVASVPKIVKHDRFYLVAILVKGYLAKDLTPKVQTPASIPATASLNWQVQTPNLSQVPVGLSAISSYNQGFSAPAFNAAPYQAKEEPSLFAGLGIQSTNGATNGFNGFNNVNLMELLKSVQQNQSQQY